MNAGALVVGEALIDEVVQAGHVGRHPGGSPANVALGLSRLNLDTRLHTTIGDDDDGELIRKHLSGSGVLLTAESTTKAPTSKAVATLADDGSATYEFALSWDPCNLENIGAPKVIHTGSLGAFLDPGADITRDILRRGRSAGALITFDPNVRPSLVPDSDNSRKRFKALAFASHLTKLSDEDAEFLFPGKSLDYVLDLLMDGGLAVAGITRGHRGAYLASGENRVNIPPVKTAVADTVGAGDSFMAALVWALVFDGGGWDGQAVSGRRLEEIGGKAARAAAITVSRTGADLPALDELTRDQARV
ncbi:carbohydrate kinase [Arthrobacter sp. SDTb3-6]|uniref:carbohydrate kinase family protein n=1 Tax=Arthrobacter sp. SDTb3-6 TaxID=2713571 RepID=UPI00159EA953|nr:carbohydrate kinase [Arthrobacter sp. SDTb3-6]